MIIVAGWQLAANRKDRFCQLQTANCKLVYKPYHIGIGITYSPCIYSPKSVVVHFGNGKGTPRYRLYISYMAVIPVIPAYVDRSGNGTSAGCYTIGSRIPIPLPCVSVPRYIPL